MSKWIHKVKEGLIDQCRRMKGTLHIERVGPMVRVRWPFGWEDQHLAPEAALPVTNGKPMTAFQYENELDALRNIGRRSFNDRICKMICRLLLVWGPMPPRKIHAGLGSDGSSNVIGGLIGTLHSHHEMIEKRDGRWGYVGELRLEELVIEAARENARTWNNAWDAA